MSVYGLSILFFETYLMLPRVEFSPKTSTSNQTKPQHCEASPLFLSQTYKGGAPQPVINGVVDFTPINDETQYMG